MADYALIEGYLATLRTSVRWRADVDDVVAEMKDHLYSTVERFESRGTNATLAQRQTLDRFGDPLLVARALASTPKGGLAMPTQDTRFAGLAGMIAGSLFAAVPVFWTLATVIEEQSGNWEGPALAMWLVGTFTLVGAIVMSFLLLVGLVKRHGGLGVAGTVGLALVALAAPTGLFAWLIVVWSGLFGGGLLIYGVIMLTRNLSPRLATVATAFGIPIGFAFVLVFEALELGWRDSYGDYPLALLAGLWIMAGVTGLGLYRLGRWLRDEEPAEVDSIETLTTA